MYLLAHLPMYNRDLTLLLYKQFFIVIKQTQGYDNISILTKHMSTHNSKRRQLSVNL